MSMELQQKVTEAEAEVKGIRISHQRQLDILAKAQLGADGTARYLAEATQKLARAEAKLKKKFSDEEVA